MAFTPLAALRPGKPSELGLLGLLLAAPCLLLTAFRLALSALCDTCRRPPGTSGGGCSRRLWRAWPITRMQPLGRSCSCCRSVSLGPLLVVAGAMPEPQRPTLWTASSWQDGERSALWDDRHLPPAAGNRPLTPSQKRELAVALAREGFAKKACNALLSTGLCAPTQATADALQALHPVQSPPDPATLAGLPVAHEIVPDAVAKALRSFPAETAPGPSGLRVQHLREAGALGCSDALYSHLAAVLNLLVQGAACPEAAATFAGASLLALPKPSGGVRPIAVGEVLRRLASKCMMALVREEARSFFWPAQLGVGVKAGTEIAVHTVRGWVGRHQGNAGKVLVKLDLANAFNTINRTHALTAVKTHFPGLARWVAWCYGQPSHLRFGSRWTVLSAGGVQQGDPLGPLLFAAALQPLANDLRTRGGLDLAVFYLDDGVLARDVGAVGLALQHIQRCGGELGLTLNLRKCEVVCMGDAAAGDLSPHLPRELLRDCASQPRIQRNFDLLGAAIGDSAFVASHTRSRVESAEPLLAALAEVEDAQVGLMLLRLPAMYAWYIACDALPPLLNLWRWRLLMRRYEPALPASRAFISLRSNGSRPVVA